MKPSMLGSFSFNSYDKDRKLAKRKAIKKSELFIQTNQQLVRNTWIKAIICLWT
jgi:hypothetical protein